MNYFFSQSCLNDTDLSMCDLTDMLRWLNLENEDLSIFLGLDNIVVTKDMFSLYNEPIDYTINDDMILKEDIIDSGIQIITNQEDDEEMIDMIMLNFLEFKDSIRICKTISEWYYSRNWW